MRCSTKGLCFPVVVLVAGCLAAGCGSTASSVINNLPSRTATITGTPGPTSTPTQGVTTAPGATSTETTTATATATVTATAAPAAPATSPGSTTTGSGSGNSLVWLWILLGAAALAGLIALIVHSARRRSATAADWQSRLIDAYAKGSALHDAMSVAEAPGEFASVNAGARWADIQRRADDLTQTLYALREAVPDDGDRARIDNTLASLQAVRSAMDAERASGGADPRQAEVVRSRLYDFEMSLRALRTGDAEYR